MKKAILELAKEAAARFNISGTLVEVEAFGGGHINSTFLARFEHEGVSTEYIIQSVNTSVFPEPVALMDNILKVTSHLKGKILESEGDPDRETLSVIPTRDDQCGFCDRENIFWRAYRYISRSTVIEKPNCDCFYSAAKTFGRFQRLLHDFDASSLSVVIPDFHNTKCRLKNLKKSVAADRLGRASGVADEINFVISRADQASKLVELLEQDKLPLRVTHNDTKLNNIMFDEQTRDGICVIDLDTVMPGLSLYDFGDAIRSGACTAQEDERDLSLVGCDLDLFRAYTKGYLESMGKFLQPLEIELLPDSAIIMTLECGMRFLTDYIDGDEYFKIHREGHNLDRCRNQFKMVADMEMKLEQMRGIVAEFAI